MLHQKTDIVACMKTFPLAALAVSAAPVATAVCTGASADLHPDDCAAYKATFDGLGGPSWTFCSDKRDDPCGCALQFKPDWSTHIEIKCSSASPRRLNFFKVRGQAVGTLPKELGALTELRFLEIQYCPGITGTLPPELANLTNVNFISFNRCSLTGEMPSSWGTTLTSVDQIVLANNKFSGTIPSAWSSLPAIGVLSLNGNQLTGTLPPELSQCANIRNFDVRGNQITGTLPSEYSAWTKVETFDIRYNQITGTLPPEYSAWTNLMSFDVRYNKLTGALPSAWDENGMGMKQPRYFMMMLAGNSFSGIVPATFGPDALRNGNGVCNIGTTNQFHCPLPAPAPCGLSSCIDAPTPPPTPAPDTSTPVYDGMVPICEVDSNGRTHIYTSSSVHTSYKCTHSGASCSCMLQHPTHHRGGCQQFESKAAGNKILNVAGDCSDSGKD